MIHDARYIYIDHDQYRYIYQSCVDVHGQVTLNLSLVIVAVELHTVFVRGDVG
jgi:hypothetical protein